MKERKKKKHKNYCISKEKNGISQDSIYYWYTARKTHAYTYKHIRSETRKSYRSTTIYLFDTRDSCFSKLFIPFILSSIHFFLFCLFFFFYYFYFTLSQYVSKRYRDGSRFKRHKTWKLQYRYRTESFIKRY